MPKITINGTECPFEGKKTILQVARENNVAIPYYCYHPGLSIVASCRICLAEVAQPNPRNDNKPELIPKLMPTCQTPAVDGMIVYSNSPKAVANQKAVMEYLLINHPLDCPVCDQAGECYLQDYSYQYGRAESRFREDKIKQPTKDIGPHVKLYSDRCIMCSRCVRFCKEVTGTGEIGVFGRGAREQIDVFPGKALDNELSANVVDICPVGALLDKDFLFTQRVWFLKPTASIDGITAGGDNIWLEQNEGRLYRLKPRPNAEVNGYWTSDEIRFGWKFVHSDDRLHGPKRTQFNEQIDVEWSSAYSEALAKLRGAITAPGNLALMVSPMLASEEAYLLAKLARTLDEKAVLAVGPIPVQGEDKTFPGGYTIRAEKCPNSRGVRAALALVAGAENVLKYEDFAAKLADKKGPFTAVIFTGNYPSEWTTKEITGSLRGKYVVAIDTLVNALTAKADVVLAGATWAEKAGTFMNADERLQSFAQAIPPLDLAKPEGQIALDLLAALADEKPAGYDPAKVRDEMGGRFVTDVHHPQNARLPQPDMEYVEL